MSTVQIIHTQSANYEYVGSLVAGNKALFRWSRLRFVIRVQELNDTAFLVCHSACLAIQEFKLTLWP